MFLFLIFQFSGIFCPLMFMAFMLKNELKNFEILKYDGIRAQRIGKWIYAEKCFKNERRLILQVKNTNSFLNG